MAWIESHQALGQHPKSLRLAELLGTSLPAAIGHLQFLWWWALDYAPDGLVAGSDLRIVAKACHWHGKPERFWDALLSSGFVETAELEGVFRVHDWMDYAGRLVQQRAANALRMRNARASHVRRTSGTRAPATGPDQPDSTGPDLNSPSSSELNPAGPAGWLPAPAHERAREADPKLLADHLALIAKDRASRQASQPIQFSSQETNGA